MTTRVLPNSDPFASCPLDGRVLAHYAGTFEAVYVAFNPFIKPVSIDVAAFITGAWPSPETVVLNCEPVSWPKVMQLADLPSLAAVDLGLRTQIHGLRKDLEKPDYAAAIDTLHEAEGIFRRQKGCCPRYFMTGFFKQ
jgi:hypothetical protein